MREDEIWQRERQATIGPWRYENPRKHGRIRNENGIFIMEHGCYGGVRTRHDGEFIAHAREDIPYLLAELHTAREAHANAEMYLAGARGQVADLEAENARLKAQIEELDKAYVDLSRVVDRITHD